MKGRCGRQAGMSRVVLCGGLLAAASGFVGCGGKTDELEGLRPEAALESPPSEAVAVPAAERLLEPFDPPALEELNARTTWLDRPTRDALAMLREAQAAEEPLASVAEALQLANAGKRPLFLDVCKQGGSAYCIGNGLHTRYYPNPAHADADGVFKNAYENIVFCDGHLEGIVDPFFTRPKRDNNLKLYY